SNAPLQRAVLELRVNGVERGEVFVVLRGSDILVPLDDLREAGLAKLEAPTEMLFDARHVSLSSCSDSLQFEYDEQALSLDLIAKPALLESTVIDLSPTSRVDAHYDYDPSWFLNYAPRLDRKSTRLNSSHVKISYAVFCLKKKTKTKVKTKK